MNINFSDKELQVIQILNPGVSPEETCDAVLRNWLNVNAAQLQIRFKTPEVVVDDIIAIHTKKVSPVKADMLK